MKIINVALGLLINRTNEVLIGRRLGSPFKKLWELPGGKLEEGETPKEALMREIKEELNIVPKKVEFFMQSQHFDGKNDIRLFFFVVPFKEQDMFPTIYDELMWVKLNRLGKNPLVPGTAYVSKYLEDCQSFMKLKQENSFGVSFANSLLHWYKREHRALPWRKTKDPYKIWLSEVMSQQTQVETVIPYYNKYIEAYPTVWDLANADEEDVLKLWEGLGYYSRAKRLRLCAMELVEKYNGKFPKDYNKVLKLPGIGPYTAGAVLSIAYNMPLPAVDGNVLRVFSRVDHNTSDISDTKVRKQFEERVASILPEDRRHYNQALMELGATVCTPKNPKCHMCPVSELCESRKIGDQCELPYKKKRQKNKQMDMEVALVYKGEELLMMKRPSTGLLADLWGFPIVEKNLDNHGDSIISELDETFGLSVIHKEHIGKAKHVFSHRTWNMTVYKIEVEEKVSPEYPSVAWCTDKTMKDYALPTAFKKVLQVL